MGSLRRRWQFFYLFSNSKNIFRYSNLRNLGSLDHNDTHTRTHDTLYDAFQRDD